jgi:pimeloyl-ACP methyl ester carboxylesterase
MASVVTMSNRRAREAAIAFLTPHRRPSPSSATPPKNFRPFTILTTTQRITGVEMGKGPTVLLVHGWEGQISDFSSLIPALLKAQYRVVGFDLPAHGGTRERIQRRNSDAASKHLELFFGEAAEQVFQGETASVPACVAACLAVQRRFGKFHAVIGHSVGGLIAAQATTAGLSCRRLVAIAAPARYESCARRFAEHSRLHPDETEEMIGALEAMETQVRTVSLPDIARSQNIPALFIHSRDDRVVPFSDSAESVGPWRNARFLRLDGLGHRRLLNFPDVVRSVASFLRADYDKTPR